ncbi:MAG: hypothetical protein HGA33_02110 [Candidatus Moranbacteria bacterium]|nr:hypothetical protein [Candidatus Moranbacteria bacterium]
MAIDHEEARQAIEKYFDRINNAQTEGDYLEELNFFINIAIFQAADDSIGWAGMVDCNTEVDLRKIEANLDVESLEKPLERLIPVFVERFHAPDPYAGDLDGFIEWYREACKRNGILKAFPDFVFRKCFTSK